MTEIATSRINTFGSSPKEKNESQQEQQLITLSISDYRNIFIQIEKLNDRIAALESRINTFGSSPKEKNESQQEQQLITLPYRDWETDRKSTRLNSSHSAKSRMPSSA